MRTRYFGLATVGVVTAALLGMLLGPAIGASADVPSDALALSTEAGRTVSGKLKRLDATAQEPGCDTKGTGKAVGAFEVEFDRATRTLKYRVAITEAPANADFLLDVSECAPGGVRLARGDGGHLRTDSAGSGRLEGSWQVQTDSKWVRATLVGYCQETDGPPAFPCGPDAFATDALLPPGR